MAPKLGGKRHPAEVAKAVAAVPAGGSFSLCKPSLAGPGPDSRF